METAKRIIFLLILAVLVISPVQSEEKQSAQISNTRTANCLVKVTCDPAILPLNLDTIDYLLRSSGVGGKARREVLGISPDQDYDLFNIEYVQLNTSEGISVPKPSTGLLPGADEYEYASMMEMEKGRNTTSQLQAGNSSSTGRSRSSSGLSTTAHRYEPVPKVRSSSRSRDRGSSPYGSFPALPAPQQRSGATISDSIDEQAYLFRLYVDLPEDVKPVAKEFMKALVDNLRQSLLEAKNTYSKDVKDLLEDAESRRDQARLQFEKAIEKVKAIGPAPEIKLNPSDAAVYEQLEQIVDLSELKSGLSFADVIKILRNSVELPLQIQPNWKDLLENAEVEQTTPANMDPLTGVKLRKALEILLAGASSASAELGYVVDEGVIIISTVDALPSKMVPCVYDIPALAYSPGSAKELVDAIRNTIDPESWFELSDAGKGTITPYPRQQPRKLAILQTFKNHQKIREFLQTITIDIPAGTPLDIPVEMLLGEKNYLFREKQNLEMELARLRGRIPAIEEQIVRIKQEIDQKVQGDQVSEELRKILAGQVKYFERVKRLVDDGSVSNSELDDAEEKLTRAKIELARRREQIGVSAGTDQLAKFSNELAMQAIDMAEKKAMLEIVSNQLNQTEQQLTFADVTDPQVSRIRMATQALETAERRVNELNTRLVNLQLPTVSVLGGE